MLESIINSAKAELGKKLTENGVADSQMDDVLGLAKESVLDNFKSSAGGGDLNGILNLFNGKQSIQSSSLVNNIVGDYASRLISKLGFSNSTANSIANIAIPFIMNMINKKTPDKGLGDNDLSELLGDSFLKGNAGNMLGKFKDLF
jgi:hypothetical protein